MRDRLARVLIAGFARLPLAVNHLIGALLGQLAWRLARESRRISLINVARCFPERDAAWQRRVAKRSLIESAKALVETPRLWRLGAERIATLVRQIEGEDVLHTALNTPQGAIFASPHLGCWELIGLFLPTRTSLTSLYRPPRLAGIDDLMRQGREHTGAHLVPTDASGIKALKKALKSGKAIGILPDQSPKGPTGVFAPFFGIQTYTMVLLNRLAQQHQAYVALCFAERLSWGRGYRMHFLHPDDAIRDGEPVTAAAAMNSGIETLIRRCPEQYAWSYKRFKRRPEGENPFYRESLRG